MARFCNSDFSDDETTNKENNSKPGRIEVSKKDEDMVDSFMSYGSNINCIEGSKLICIRSQDNIRHSAFGAQIISDGKMFWKLKVEQGHSIKIGISGVSSTSNEDFTSSKYGYGYGDDGCIYTNNGGDY